MFKGGKKIRGKLYVRTPGTNWVELKLIIRKE